MPPILAVFSPGHNNDIMGNLDNEAGGLVPEPQPTDCLSSSFTLVWRIFVPIFGTVVLSGFAFTLIMIPEENLFLSFPALWARLGALLLLAIWLFGIKRTIWRLKRIDANETHLFVTNYWQTVRYPWTDVEEILETQRLGRRLVHFKLVAPGRFGQVLSLLPASHYDEFMKKWNLIKI